MSESSLAGAWRHPPESLRRACRAVYARQVPLFMAASVAVGAALLFGRLDQGWWPHDDGSLAHSAERVLGGELPHRDFAELYTGLLTFLNAGVFALLGEDIFNLRLPLFVLFLAFVACFFAIARRVVAPAWAFAATIAATTWSVPVYPAPMPSWYLLFLTVFGTYAVVRFLETRWRPWLFLAGVCGGVGVAIKITGIWFVAAVCLALLAEAVLDESSGRRVSRWYGALVIAVAAGTLGIAVAIVANLITAGNVLGLMVPVASASAAVGWLGCRTFRGQARDTPAGRVGDVGLFLVGAVVPMALLVAPYAATSSVDDLVAGVFLGPQSRYEFASQSLPHPATLLWALPVVGALLVRRKLTVERRQKLDVAVSAAIAFLLLTARDTWSYSVIWNATRALAPVLVCVGAYALVRRSLVSPPHRATLATLVLVAAFALLVQFPFSAPVYFCYVAPLLLISAIATLRALGLGSGLLPGVLLVALAIFGARELDKQSMLSLGFGYVTDPQNTTLDSTRANIRVRPAVAAEYRRITELVKEHRASDVIFAGPDAPAVYFLTQSRNPTPAILDFVDTSGATAGSSLLRRLRQHDINVVVMNNAPEQSTPIEPSTAEEIRALYPNVEEVGAFEVRWRDPS